MAALSDTLFTVRDSTQVFDPGGAQLSWTVSEYLEDFVVHSQGTLYLSVLADDKTGGQYLWSDWTWDGAMDPPDRNPLRPLNPHFMKSLYTHWQFTHGTQVTVITEKVCMDPTHPDEGLPSRPPSELSDTARLRLQDALTVADWLKTDTQPMQSSEIEDMLREAYSLADLDFGVSEAVSAGQGYELPLPTMMRDLDDLVLCEGDLCCLAEKNFPRTCPIQAEH